MERECKDLEKSLEVYLDDKKVELPSIESIVILNIPSWAAGVDLWKMGGLYICVIFDIFKDSSAIYIYILH